MGSAFSVKAILHYLICPFVLKQKDEKFKT